jgi:ATPase subunit of ABC transporter with duplicated ATPase domains
VVGPNGTGKSTLLRMMAGLEPPSNGEVRLMPGYDAGIWPQEPVLSAGKTVLGNVQEGVAETKALVGRYNEITAELAADCSDDLLAEMGRLQEQLRAGRAEIPSRACVAAFGFKGSDQQKPAGLMSGGERGRLNLALTLKQGGNLLLLDEPANDLDVETLAWLERALAEFPGCAAITSHDRWFLDLVATHILAWEGGASWYWFEGNFAAYEQNKVSRLGEEAAGPHRVTYRRLTR